MAATDPNNVWVRRSAKHGLVATKPSSTANPLYPTSSNRSSATQSASKSFGLGSGAFASFGSTGNSGTLRENQSGPEQGVTKQMKVLLRKSHPDPGRETAKESAESSGSTGSAEIDTSADWTLQQPWAIWYRPPAPKNSDYEKSLQPICHIGCGQDFWKVYVHLKRPSKLPVVSDYHFFRDGVRPVWEDGTNRYGGKWILRLKKGLADRYWENILLALIGNDYDGFSDDVSGVVLSVRSVEDVLSVWTKTNDSKTGRIRDALQKCLDLPADTVVVFKTHDDSIAQRVRGQRQSQLAKSTTGTTVLQ